MLMRMRRNRNPLALLVGMQTGAATLENSVEVLNSLLGIYTKDAGVLIHRGTCTPMFIAVLSTIAKLCIVCF